jgi:hypothetical protein
VYRPTDRRHPATRGCTLQHGSPAAAAHLLPRRAIGAPPTVGGPVRDDAWRTGRPFEGRRSHRRRAGVLLPSSLAFVAAAAATAVAVAAAGNGGDLSTATPPAWPPALGDVPPAPPGDPVVPPESATASPPGTAEPSRDASGAASRVGQDQVAAPAGPALRLDRAAVPGVVNLSAEGSRDWVHWGQQGVWSLERRRGGGFAILEGTPTAPRERHEAGAQTFAWRGGEPVDSTDDVRSGIRTCGAGNGFTVSAPATDGVTRTLRVYVGVFQSRGRLQARLDGADPVSAVLDGHGQEFAAFTITYRAQTTGRVRLSWVTQRTYGGDGCHGVALQAATLHQAP